MRRFGVSLAVLAVVALAVMVQAAQTGSTKAQAPATKSMSATGVVSAVVPDSLTVKGKGADWTFVIDNKTTVTAKGATHRTLALKAEGKKPMLTDFVKVGDQVSVTYRETGATKHAATIRVTAQAK